jgi:hypothetical protein
MFHHVEPPQGDPNSGRADLEAFGRTVDALVPPRLEDNLGTRYKPVAERPVSAQGTGGIPDPVRPRAVTGVWRYQPPASPSATAFSVATANAGWRVAVRNA